MFAMTIMFPFSLVQSLSHVQLFVTPWPVACQASLSITNSQSLLKLMSIGSMMPSNHLILCCPFSCFPSFPASGSFQMSQLFASRGQNIGVSASTSVLPMETQDRSLGWTGWISLQSKGLSRSSLTPQFKSINCSALSFLYTSTLTSIYTHSHIGKTIALIRWTFARKVMSLLFNKCNLGDIEQQTGSK